MKTPHKHAELIKAWADGAEIQWYDSSPREHRWIDCPEYFDWGATCQFRIKPEPKKKVKRWLWIIKNSLFADTYFVTNELLTEAEAVKGYGMNVIKKLEHTEFVAEVL